MAMKKYAVRYSIPVVYYEVEANSPSEAVDIADDMFAQYLPDTLVQELTPADEDKNFGELNNWKRVR